SLTPQAQLAYSSVRFDSFTDAYGSDVSLDDGDSLTGRLVISADFDSEWKDASGKTSRSTLYGIANLYYDFHSRNYAGRIFFD
ncbi:autotransporter outer membrane beta-barrel domain-containing protein, partial [Rhizobium johnstonii]|uniref:autotransporter outer membrane beta-barrel domain-containing protein n=1 Tax=Rhizobium johnstonii TaxID=3019933 RepID=UPI003F9AEA5C